jgi:hypothetical protein
MLYPAVLLFFIAIPALAQLAPIPPLAPQTEYYRDLQDRVHSYIFRTYTDPSRLSWLLVDCATDQWTRAPHQWDNSAESYSYRVASAMGRRIVSNTVQLGFETALREDSRYRKSGERRFGKRVLAAVSHSVLAYKPDGSLEPMYGRIAAGIVTAAASSTWHPQAINASSLLAGAAQGAIDRAEGNLLTEFEPDLKNFGRRTWNVVRGK